MGGIEMSDTPISDSTAHNVGDLGMLCRRLERELNEAKELIKRLEVAAWKNYNNAHKEKEAKP
jgi:hypothetical protein